MNITSTSSKHAILHMHVRSTIRKHYQRATTCEGMRESFIIKHGELKQRHHIIWADYYEFFLQHQQSKASLIGPYINDLNRLNQSFIPSS